MDIILHIGAHRTATTTFQTFLERNGPALTRAGIAAWTPARARTGLLSGLIHRPEDITEEIERRGTRSAGVMRVEAERLARAGMRHLVISEENMLGSMRNNLRERRLYPLADERLRRFGPAVAGRRLRVVLAIRSYDRYWASMLAYLVARGQALPSLATLDRLVTQPRRWRDVAAEAARVFPAAEVIVWPFERLAGRPEVQLELATGAAVPEGLSGRRARRNASLPREALRAALDARGDRAGLAAIGPGEGRWMPFDTDQEEALRGQYREDLVWFARGEEPRIRLVTDETTTGERARNRAAGEAGSGVGPMDGGREDERQGRMG